MMWTVALAARAKVGAMFKKHEDFDKAIGNQEDKIECLTTYPGQLITTDHYARDDIDNKRRRVLSVENS